MALAETAELVVRLRLADGLTGPVKSATVSVSGLDDQVARTSSRMSMLSRVSGGVSSSLGHLRTRAGQLAGVVGLAGLGGGVVALGGFLRSAVRDAEEFGTSIDRVRALTKLSTETTSQLVDALGYYGIEGARQVQLIGMQQRNLAALTESKKTATAFEKQYGFSLLDSNGRVKDSLELISSFTSYFNDKGIPAQVRAAAAAKLWGRSWQDLIPIFQQGRTEWDRQLSAGMRLTDSQVRDLHEMRDAQRAWNDALGDFKVQAGLVVIPVLKDLAKAAAAWLNDPENSHALIRFLRQGVQLARDFGGYLAHDVIPQVRDLAGAAVGFWNSIPGPLRDLLVKGIAVDRTVKFLFGFSLTGVATNVIGDAISGGLKGLFGQFFARGSSPANPLYVAGALGGGGAGGTVVGGGRLGGIGRVLGAVAITGEALAVLQAIQDFNATTAAAQQQLAQQAEAGGNQEARTAMRNLGNLVDKLSGLQGLDRVLADTFGGKEQQDALRNLAHAIATNGRLTASEITGAIDILRRAQVEALARGNQEVADAIGADIAKLQGQQSTAAERLRDQVRRGDTIAAGLLRSIQRKPTRLNVDVHTTVNTSVSTRDVESRQNVTNRYGAVAV